MLRGLMFASCLIAGAGAALAWEQKEADVPQCPERLVAGTASLVCACPSEATATGSVWGSDPYTDDSAICRAALHAGVIGTDGGFVEVVEVRGQSSYPAVTRNSVASGQWGNWGRSIAFRSSSGERRAESAPSIPACPVNAVSLPAETRLTCACAPGAAASGSIWGSGPYTADSLICRAAVHAGAIGLGGGVVRLRVVPGQSAYPASRRNGVDSGSWASYGTSFEVDRN